MNHTDRSVNKLFEKLDALEGVLEPGEEYDQMMRDKFAKLKLERAKADPNIKLGITVDKMTDEELDYYKTHAPKITPEENYQYLKEHWYFHDSCWYMRGADRYDGKGCHNGVCIPECRYYHEEGRIEEGEVESWYKD